jgi:acetyltransferase
MIVDQRIEALFAPRNVALVGASDRNWSPRVWDNLRRFGFEGKVFPVNPNRSELWGARCYATLADLPERPDHLALFVPNDQSLQVLEEGGLLGARSASIYAAGFGEGGDPAGLARAQRLRQILARFNIGATGPNCMGLAVGRSRFCTFPDEHLEPLKPGGVAALTQSGMLGQTFSRGIVDAGLDLAYLVSCGNQTGLTFADYIGHLAEDPALKVITCYVESVIDGAAFLASAKKARDAGKSVVVVKAGGSEESRKATLAHTGSLAGSTQVFDAFARQGGIIRVDSLEDMVEAAAFLSRMPRPRGRRVGVITNSGALKSLMTEAAETYGLELAALAPQTGPRLREALADADVSNPFDTKRTVRQDEYMGCVRALHDDPNVDLLLLAEEMPREAGIERKVRNLTALNAFVADEATKPVAVFSPLTFRETGYMADLRKDLTAFPWLRDIGKTFRTLARILANQDAAEVVADSLPGDRSDLIAAWRARAARLSAPTALNEADSKALLAAYGIVTPREIVALDPEAAAVAAGEIGFPVVLKAIAAGVPHKSDAGLVFLDLRNAEAVRAAAREATTRCALLDTPLEGLLVAQQVSGGTEMVLGLNDDPEMGHAIMVGMGGVWLELFKDVAFATPQLNEDVARTTIAKTRAATLLHGYRGGAPGDVPALARAMIGLATLARELGDVIAEVDINPIIVMPEGRGAIALDGLVVLQPPNR